MTTIGQDLQRFDMFIGGQATQTAFGATMPSFDPYRGEDWAEVPRADRADVDRAVAAARAAFDDGPWPRLTGRDRGRLILRLAQLIEERADELAELEVRDNGNLFREMSAQFRSLIPDYYYCYYFAGAADKIEGDVFSPPRPNYFAYSLREPVGVVAGVTAWNSPAALMTYKLAAALAAGWAMGDRLIAGLHQLAERQPVIGDVRGEGLLVGIGFRDPATGSAFEPSVNFGRRFTSRPASVVCS